MERNERQQLPVGKHINQYEILDYIGGGGFGDIYVVTNGSDTFAMKIEFYEAPKQSLVDEIRILSSFKGSHSPLMTHLYEHGVFENFRFLILDLLGPSVSTMRRALPARKFTKKTTVILAYHMFCCIEECHNLHIIHRDVKPGNFLIRACRQNPLCLIDFGLSKFYINQYTGRHINFSDTAGFTGTCRYASIHAHQNMELSRRDDLISWFYSVYELIEGRLPWPGSKDLELTQRTKEIIATEEICRSLPRHFIKIYEHILSLKYDQSPNYPRIKQLLLKAIKHVEAEEMDWRFDWESMIGSDEVDSISKIDLTLNDPPEETGIPDVSDSESIKCTCHVF